jgi:hypothetical protein
MPHFFSSSVRKVKIARSLAFYFVLLVVSTYTFWILNENVAFFGVYKVEISNFFHLPRTVALNPRYKILNTNNNKFAQLASNKIEIDVVLPRGFKTIDVIAKVHTDKAVQVSLGANTAEGYSQQFEAYIVPGIFHNFSNRLNIPGGQLITNNPEIRSSAQFIENYIKFKKIIGVGPNPLEILPLPKINSVWEPINIPFPIRGDFTVDAFLGPQTRSLSFQKIDLNFSSKICATTLNVTKNGKIIVQKKIYSKKSLFGVAQSQLINVSLPELQEGFYALQFLTNNEGCMVQDLAFIGTEVKFSNSILLGPYNSSVHLIANCKNIDFSPSKQSGVQTVIVNKSKYFFQKIKHVFPVKTISSPASIQLQHGDIMVRSGCGFILNQDQPIRTMVDYLNSKISILPNFTQTDIDSADAILNTLVEGKADQEGDGFFEIQKTFTLTNLAANGKKFTFYIETPNDPKNSNYLEVKSIRFTAHRPALSFSDISKAYHSIFRSFSNN